MNLDHFLQSINLRLGTPTEGYPFDIPAVRRMGKLEFHERCTYLIGENGSGKSTILEALAISFNLQAEGGSRNFKFKTFDTHSDLFKWLDVAKGVHRPNDMFFLRAETFYNFAAQVDKVGVQQYYGGSLHAKSHGESFFALFMNRFHGRGLYLLDEPEAALSPNRQLAFLARMHDLVKAGSQFVIATHAPIVMAYPDAWLYQLTDKGVERVEYEDTEHYQVTSDFFKHRKRMLKELMQ
jgi:predicted ATPase